LHINIELKYEVKKLQAYQIKEDEMVRTCDMYGRQEKFIHHFSWKIWRGETTWETQT